MKWLDALYFSSVGYLGLHSRYDYLCSAGAATSNFVLISTESGSSSSSWLLSMSNIPCKKIQTHAVTCLCRKACFWLKRMARCPWEWFSNAYQGNVSIVYVSICSAVSLFWPFCSQDLMTDPYILCETGVSYERVNIEEWISNTNG